MLLAIGVGAGLGLSGVLVQGVIRNPLASPDLMGISAGAGLAATACLVLYPNAPVAMLPMVAMAGGLLAAGFIAVLAYWSKPTPARLALIGVAVSAFLASGIDFLLIVHPIEINTAMVWLTGSLWGRNWQQVPFIWSALLLLLPLAFWLAWRLDVMGLGEESATTLGTKPRQIQILALIAAVLLAAGAKGKRYSLPNSRILIHQPWMSGLGGQATDIDLAAKEILRMRERINEIFVQHTGQDIKRIQQDTERDYIMNADQGKEYGIIDDVIRKRV